MRGPVSTGNGTVLRADPWLAYHRRNAGARLRAGLRRVLDRALLAALAAGAVLALRDAGDILRILGGAG